MCQISLYFIFVREREKFIYLYGPFIINIFTYPSVLPVETPLVKLVPSTESRRVRNDIIFVSIRQLCMCVFHYRLRPGKIAQKKK